MLCVKLKKSLNLYFISKATAGPLLKLFVSTMNVDSTDYSTNKVGSAVRYYSRSARYNQFARRETSFMRF